MAIQYITDNSGNKTAIIIPIKLWNNLTAVHEDLKQLDVPVEVTDKRKLSDFKGCISKETALKMIEDIELSRSHETNIAAQYKGLLTEKEAKKYDEYLAQDWGKV